MTTQKEQKHEYYLRNQKKIIARSTEWNKVHKQRHQESQRRWRQKNIEYLTVQHHHGMIFRKFHSDGHNYRHYKGMPFFNSWNPDKGGSFRTGANWIIKNLGRRPEDNSSLHIVKHEKGFVPGNLVWASKFTQSNQLLFKIVARLRHQVAALKKRLQKCE
jgi:hypothetical protein